MHIILACEENVSTFVISIEFVEIGEVERRLEHLSPVSSERANLLIINQ